MARHKAESPEHAHAAIRAFLDAYYARTHPDDVGPLLGQLVLLGAARPVDPACRRRWNEAVSRALSGMKPIRLH